MTPWLGKNLLDTGNPVFPAYNDIFRSSDYLPVRETFNFPYWKTADLWDALTLPYTVIVHSSSHTTTEAMPPGAYGLLVAAIVLAVFVILIDLLVSAVEKRLLVWRPEPGDARG